VGPELNQPVKAASLWTGPRSDPRRYRVDLVDGVLVNIGDGGEGLVFRAIGQFGDQERDVALKMHTSLTLEDFDRFSLRAQALSEIDHPNVMHVIEVFLGTGLVDRQESPDDAFNVMYTVADWIPGLSLPSALEATDAACGLRWVAEIARATSYLHNFRSEDSPEGFIHRDIKPSNVRIDMNERAVLIDFGIARPHKKGDLTEGAGTYLWRAPEIVGGPGEPGPASDVWGVGALAYWVLMCEPPRLEGAETARKILEPAARHATFVDPPGLSHTISELLETHPKDRPTDLLHWARQLELSVVGRRRRHTRRRLIVVAALAVVVFVAAAISALMLVGPSGSSPTKSTSFAFKPQAFETGLIVDRTWTLSGTRSDHLEGSTTVINGNPGPITSTYDEVLPESVARSVKSISFNPRPKQILQPDPVVAYGIDLASGGTERITFEVNIGPTQEESSTRLHRLAQAQESAEAAYLTSTHQAPAATLETLQITPTALTLSEGQSKQVTLSGTMSNGSAAVPGVLAGVTWTSSAPTIASASSPDIVYGLTTGTATITAHTGSIAASLTVTVAASAAQPQSSGGSGAISNTPNSAASSNGSSLTQSGTGTKGATQPTSSGIGSITNLTTTTLPLPPEVTTTTALNTSSRTVTVFGPMSNSGLLVSPSNTQVNTFQFETTISNISEICASFSFFEGIPSGGGLQWAISPQGEGLQWTTYALGDASILNTELTTVSSNTSSCMDRGNQPNWTALTASLANGTADLSMAWQNAGSTTPVNSSFELSQATMTITGSFG
jgi:serine/threonine protein kinase